MFPLGGISSRQLRPWKGHRNNHWLRLQKEDQTANFFFFLKALVEKISKGVSAISKFSVCHSVSATDPSGRSYFYRCGRKVAIAMLICVLSRERARIGRTKLISLCALGFFFPNKKEEH